MLPVRLPLVAALLALALAGGGGAVATAARPAAPTPADCATDGYQWPARPKVQGATFLGVAISGWQVADRGSTRFRVLRTYAGGPFADIVRVAVVCVETRFRIGARYLISSGAPHRRDGEIVRIGFGDHGAVAWRAQGGRVRLIGYGAGIGEAPAWAADPDTVREAVRSVVPG